MTEQMTYSQFFDAARDGLKLGPDRHPKWTRVEPGTVIPASQPYRIEYARGTSYILAHEFENDMPITHDGSDKTEWFVDSSWRPPLELPTEPTWGIVLSKRPDRKDGHMADIGRWAVYGDEEWSPLERTHRSAVDTPCDVLSRQNIADFIPLTDEQVSRIEAAR